MTRGERLFGPDEFGAYPLDSCRSCAKWLALYFDCGCCRELFEVRAAVEGGPPLRIRAAFAARDALRTVRRGFKTAGWLAFCCLPGVVLGLVPRGTGAVWPFFLWGVFVAACAAARPVYDWYIGEMLSAIETAEKIASAEGA